MSYKLINVSKKYNDNIILDDINLELPDKGLISIIGDSGSGKTTLLNILGGIDKPTYGDIYFDKYNMSNDNILDKLRNSVISFSFQDANLFNDMTVYENISIALEFQNKKRNEINETIVGILSKLDIEEYKNTKIHKLSAGQIARASIARALAKNCKVLLCDEPTGNLDNNNSKGIFRILKELSKEILIVVVTHDTDLAYEYSDRLYEIDNHNIILRKNDIKNAVTCDIELKKSHLKIITFFKLLMNNILNVKLVSILLLIMLTLLFTLFSSIFSLMYYDETSAYLNTFKNNDQYLIQTSKYRENDIKYRDAYNGGEDGYSYLKAEIYYEDLKEKDKPKLESKINHECDVYVTYFYNISLNNFIDGNDANLVKTSYSVGFKTIMVSDFKKFNQPLKYGTLPKNKNEILIYDYMEDSLIYNKIVDSSILGKILYDNVNDISFKVTGVLNSQYEKYIDIDRSKYNPRNNYISSYYNELETIICSNETFNDIHLSNNYCFNDVYLESKDTKNKISNIMNCDKTLNINSFNYDYIYNNLGSNPTGFIITKKLAMKLVGINDVSEFDNSTLGTEFKGSEAFVNKFQISSHYENTSQDIEASYLVNNFVKNFIAVTDDIENEEIYYINSYNLLNKNLKFRTFYLSLNSNWNDNYKIIDKLTWPEDKDDSYYEKLTEGNEIIDFCIYNSMAEIVVANRGYIPSIVSVCRIILYIVLALSLLMTFFTIYYSISNNYYKIGVVKSLGVNNSKILLIYSSVPFVVNMIAFVLSIPLSYVMMSIINKSFTEEYNISASILNVRPISFLVSLGIGLLVYLVGILVPLIKLNKLTPIQMIRENK